MKQCFRKSPCRLVKFESYMLVDAVTFGPVSMAQFPANRENYSEIAKRHATATCKQRAPNSHLTPWRQITDLKQGIRFDLAGIVVRLSVILKFLPVIAPAHNQCAPGHHGTLQG